MNTIVIENADKSTTAIFKALAKKLGLPIKLWMEEEPGTITNPEILQRIENYENGKASLHKIEIDALTKLIND